MKKLRKAAIALSVMVCLAAYGIHWAFFCIQRLDGQEVLEEVTSPDGRYIITAYLNNGGATTDFGILCSVKDIENGRTRNIYWQYHCREADVQWTDGDSAVINGVVLDVWNDIYDYRHSGRQH